MKNRIMMALLVALLLCLTSCGAKDITIDEKESVVDVRSAGIEQVTVGTAKVDYDLTGMEFNMLYSTVVDMTESNPQTYRGKTVRLTGSYQESQAEGELAGTVYHWVIGGDVTACCNWNIEILMDDSVGTFPAPGTQVTVTGVMSSYEELGTTYNVLQVTELTTA